MKAFILPLLTYFVFGSTTLIVSDTTSPSVTFTNISSVTAITTSFYTTTNLTTQINYNVAVVPSETVLLSTDLQRKVSIITAVIPTKTEIYLTTISGGAVVTSRQIQTLTSTATAIYRETIIPTAAVNLRYDTVYFPIRNSILTTQTNLYRETGTALYRETRTNYDTIYLKTRYSTGASLNKETRVEYETAYLPTRVTTGTTFYQQAQTGYDTIYFQRRNSTYITSRIASAATLTTNSLIFDTIYFQNQLKKEDNLSIRSSSRPSVLTESSTIVPSSVVSILDGSKAIVEAARTVNKENEIYLTTGIFIPMTRSIIKPFGITVTFPVELTKTAQINQTAYITNFEKDIKIYTSTEQVTVIHPFTVTKTVIETSKLFKTIKLNHLGTVTEKITQTDRVTEVSSSTAYQTNTVTNTETNVFSLIKQSHVTSTLTASLLSSSVQHSSPGSKEVIDEIVEISNSSPSCNK